MSEEYYGFENEEELREAVEAWREEKAIEAWREEEELDEAIEAWREIEKHTRDSLFHLMNDESLFSREVYHVLIYILQPVDDLDKAAGMKALERNIPDD